MTENPKPIDYYRKRSHNPFLKAVPPFPESIADLKTALASDHLPPDEEVRNAPIEDRVRFLAHLRTLHIPLNRDVELAHFVRDILVDRYTACMPNAEHVAGQSERIDAFTRRALSKKQQDDDFEATGYALTGPSGIGKSRLIKRILRLFPQVVDMDIKSDLSLPPKVVTWVRVETPSNRTVSALIDAIFTALELATVKKIPQVIRGRNISENVEAIGIVCDEVRLGVLVLDEIQHVLRRDHTPDGEMMNFLVALGNSLGVPILVIGTPLAEKVVGGEMRQARRMVGPKLRALKANSKAWKELIKGLHCFQFTRELIPIDELDRLLFQHSQGLPGIAVLLYRFAQRYALAGAEDKERVSEGILNAVKEDLFHVVQPMLNALESGDEDRIALYEDLSFESLEMDSDTLARLVALRVKQRQNLEKAAIRYGTRGTKLIKKQILRDATALAGPGGLNPRVLAAMQQAAKKGDDVLDAAAAEIRLEKQ